MNKSSKAAEVTIFLLLVHVVVERNPSVRRQTVTSRAIRVLSQNPSCSKLKGTNLFRCTTFGKSQDRDVFVEY
jgi:hypothetical protein